MDPSWIPNQKTTYLKNKQLYYLVVSTHLKNISQIGSFPQVGLKIKNLWNHQLVYISVNPGWLAMGSIFHDFFFRGSDPFPDTNGMDLIIYRHERCKN